MRNTSGSAGGQVHGARVRRHGEKARLSGARVMVNLDAALSIFTSCLTLPSEAIMAASLELVTKADSVNPLP